MKRTLSVILALSIAIAAISCASISAAGAEDGIARGVTGDCTWELDGTELTISGSGAMEDYYYDPIDFGVILAPWGNEITSVTIEDGVTHIGEQAFVFCRELENINIPDSVTSAGRFAFFDTPWYEAQPDGVVYIGKAAYNYKGDCPESVVIADGTVSISADAFRDRAQLKNISIPDSVINIGYRAFEGTDWYNSKPDGIVYAGKAAYTYKGKCVGSIEIADGTAGIADNAFHNQKEMKGAVIPDSVIEIGDSAFLNCPALEELVIGGGVRSIGRMAFGHCKALQSVDIPGSVNSIGDDAFCNCDSLSGVTVPPSVKRIGSRAFGYRYDTKVEGFTVSGYEGTEAERYAAENGFAFISLGIAPTEPANGHIVGDADTDGEITILDATAIQRVLASLDVESYDESAADADEDGEVTILDATAVQRHLAGLPCSENIGKTVTV